MLTVKTADGQAFYFVSGLRHALHFHSSAGSYEEYFCIGTFGPDGIGYGYSGEDVSARAAPADNYSKFLVHFSNVYFWQK